MSGPYLSTPGGLESICMRFRKRRSRLTTSGVQLGRVSDASTVNFAFPCPAATVPAPSRTELHSDLTNCIWYTKSHLASKSMLTYPRGSTSNLSPWMVLPRHSTVHIASAMVKLVGFHHFITFRGVRTGFLWFLTCFSSFLHDFSSFLNFPSAGTHPFDDK